MPSQHLWLDNPNFPLNLWALSLNTYRTETYSYAGSSAQEPHGRFHGGVSRKSRGYRQSHTWSCSLALPHNPVTTDAAANSSWDR